VKKDNTSITLLGFILDADNPHKNNNEILLGLMPPLFGGHDPLLKVQLLWVAGGILIVDNAEDVENCRRLFWYEDSLSYTRKIALVRLSIGSVTTTN